MGRGGATSKLFVNSVLNSCSRHGPALGNQAAILTLFYCVFKGAAGTVRGTDDVFNSTAGGLLSGSLYKSAAQTWPTTAKYSVFGGVFVSGVNFALRSGYM